MGKREAMTDYDQIAQGCVSPVLLAAINERKEQYIYEGYVRWGLVERHIIEHVAAALRAAHAAGVAVERERCAGITDGTPHAAQLALLGDDIDDEYRAEYEAEIEIRNILTAAIRKGE